MAAKCCCTNLLWVYHVECCRVHCTISHLTNTYWNVLWELVTALADGGRGEAPTDPASPKTIRCWPKGSQFHCMRCLLDVFLCLQKDSSDYTNVQRGHHGASHCLPWMIRQLGILLGNRDHAQWWYPQARTVCQTVDCIVMWCSRNCMPATPTCPKIIPLPK